MRKPRSQNDGVNRFAFVVHPLDVGFIHRYGPLRWTRRLPDRMVESAIAHLPPFPLARVTGARSPATGQRVEGILIGLGATPRQMLRRDPSFTYRRLVRAARMAAARGARIMGLGAFTSVVGDAGVSVSRRAPISVTSGNSLTVSATLETAKQAARRMELDPSTIRAMVIGATGSIGAACARMIARWTRDVVLVSIEPDRLVALERLIRSETPEARIVVATTPRGLLGDRDVIVTATSAFGQRILEIVECKPGAVICDVARPPDISAAEAALRPDVAVLESGEVLLPGEADLGYDLGLPPGVSYACLAETALLAMEGRFESFTLGRDLRLDRIQEIYRLFRMHDFRIAPLRSHGKLLTDGDFAHKRDMAAALRSDLARFDALRREAARRLATIAPASKGVAPRPEPRVAHS